MPSGGSRNGLFRRRDVPRKLEDSIKIQDRREQKCCVQWASPCCTNNTERAIARRCRFQRVFASWHAETRLPKEVRRSSLRRMGDGSDAGPGCSNYCIGNAANGEIRGAKKRLRKCHCPYLASHLELDFKFPETLLQGSSSYDLEIPMYDSQGVASCEL